MSANDQAIICRRCGETISMTVGNCPRCGAEIRGRRGPIGALIVGLIVMGASATDIEQLWLFGILGLLLAFGGAYFLYDRRQRMQSARTGAQ